MDCTAESLPELQIEPDVDDTTFILLGALLMLISTCLGFSYIAFFFVLSY